jgi:hypothetical protein
MAVVWRRSRIPLQPPSCHDNQPKVRDLALTTIGVNSIKVTGEQYMGGGCVTARMMWRGLFHGAGMRGGSVLRGPEYSFLFHATVSNSYWNRNAGSKVASAAVTFCVVQWRQAVDNIDTDWGVFSWPWKLFPLMKADRPSLWPVTDVCHLKMHWGWRAVVFCACEVLQLFSAVFYVVRAVHKFEFRLVINETPSKWRPVEIRSCSDRDLCFWRDVYIFSGPSSRILRDSTHAVQVSCILLSKGH